LKLLFFFSRRKRILGLLWTTGQPPMWSDREGGFKSHRCCCHCRRRYYCQRPSIKITGWEKTFKTYQLVDILYEVSSGVFSLSQTVNRHLVRTQKAIGPSIHSIFPVSFLSFTTGREN
jgi:hypothetical protein